ncbi:uncharacterized protein PITG_11025 [Phytophthora infestans T30-4]|uniref:Uncharacterized protein n=1 Tax=Phytophthora infestans (strain T30-4) TaxID=403677 RepID=D0NG03_PHYIT|nr:uncharacterized protein PITG_11025 [Phytophthora infestans T30-4]EEY57204.1 hypothetical protein PITG_11025 [Phytophthora infestans T30-4]|eukprot:XP_002901814.1 hypothetical protein PITG_11025 [Phytophthora infestans T30-4]
MRKIQHKRWRDAFHIFALRKNEWFKQKRTLELRKLEVARQQKERLKLALAGQKAKEADQEYKRRCRNERIRAEEQQAKELRAEKLRQLREAATKQHFERLMTEKQRQHEALNLVAVMEEEERNLRLRLEALHFHREYMEQELCSSDLLEPVPQCSKTILEEDLQIGLTEFATYFEVQVAQTAMLQLQLELM